MLLACSLCVGGLWAPYSPWCLACGSVWAVCASCIGHGCPVGCVLVACGPGSGRGLRVGYVLAGWWLALDCMWALRGGGILLMLWDSCTACASLPVGRVWTDTGFAHGLHVLCWWHVCWCCCGSWHDTRRVAGVSTCGGRVYVWRACLCAWRACLCAWRACPHVVGVSTRGGRVSAHGGRVHVWRACPPACPCWPRARAGRVPLPVSCSRQPGAGCAHPSGCARPGRERQRAPAGTRERALHLSRHSARPADPDHLGAGPGRRWGGSRVTIRSPPGLGPPNITVWDNEGPVAAPPQVGPPLLVPLELPALLPAPPRCPCPPHCPSPPGLSAAALLAILGCGTSLLALAGLLARGRPKGGGRGQRRRRRARCAKTSAATGGEADTQAFDMAALQRPPAPDSSLAPPPALPPAWDGPTPTPGPPPRLAAGLRLRRGGHVLRQPQPPGLLLGGSAGEGGDPGEWGPLFCTVAELYGGQEGPA
ncbi:unnamed protein product [Lepidochelys kempii]